MAPIVSTKLVPRLARRRTRRIDDVGAPSANASEKSSCEGKGGTYTETAVTWNGKSGTTYRCCVKDAATNTTSCTSTTVTKQPIRERSPRVDRHRLTTDAQIQPAP